jgi:4-amino-4-deoxy-L-arabinose transferase-like glycosyltransferase
MAYTSKSDMTTVKKIQLKIFSHIDPWLVAVLTCFTLLAWANWGKVSNPIMDFSREVEIPARLVDGQLLYRDASTYYGPLGYYANALALLVFGHRLEVFYVVGLVLGLVTTLLFYRLAKRLTNTRWAALSTICMLLYCAIGPGLFNFIVPYSYGAVYATVLCLLAVTFLDYYTYKGQIKWLVAAAIACGLAGLAKQEYGVAALGGVLVGANLYFPQNFRTRVTRSLLVLAVASACTFLPLALLAQQVSWEKLYLSLFPIPKADFLKQSTLFQVSPAKTLRHWLATFRHFFAASILILLSVAAANWISKLKFIPNFKRFRFFVEILVGVALAWISLSFLGWVCQFIPYFNFLHSITDIVFHPLRDMSWCLPVFVGWFALNRPQSPQYKHAPLLWTLLVFSLLLNARWLFYINFYGLYATPVVLLFFTLLYYLTQRVRGVVWRYLVVCLLIGGSMNLGSLAQYRYAVNSSYGTFYTWNTTLASSFNQTIQAINSSKATSVLVLPEGSILSFMTATRSPSRIITFQPIALLGSEAQQDFIASMKINPPELIVFVDMLFREWGYENYAEFNPLVSNWITQQHRLTHTFPIPVFPEGEGFIRIYSRN